jgi:fructosamine-3-kinase
MIGQPLPDPESLWERAPTLVSAEPAEVERRIGPIDDPIRVLPGGHSNLNLLLGDRVLRIYRRDPQAAAREARLLSRGWRSFRVPRVLAEGPDFLLLEYLGKSPVLGTADHGAALGRALAEIHAVSYEATGLLDDELRVAHAFPDVVTTLLDYARTELADCTGLPVALREELLKALETRTRALRLAAGPPALVHGDFKPSNLHWTLEGQPLVLDWEFAYAGSGLSDVGQLLRWRPPEPFVTAFAETYGENGGPLVGDWRTWAEAFDAVNLVGLLANLTRARPHEGSARSVCTADIQRRLEETLRNLR